MRSPLVSSIIVASIAALSSCRSSSSITRTLGSESAVTRVRTRALLLSRHEITFDVPLDGVHPDDIVIDARFTSPSGSVVKVGGFRSREHFKVRFTPREIGVHTWSIQAGGRGREVARGEIDVVASDRRGFVRVDPTHRHRLVLEDGTTVFVLGENRINVYDPNWNYERADIRSYVERMASYGMTAIRVFVFADCESETTPGGYQIGCLEPAPGRFDELTADAFDTLFDVAEQVNVDVVLVAQAVGFTPGTETWRSWNDNPYSTARGGPARSPSELFTSPALRKRTVRKLRYIADRWASSPRLLAIDLLNEPEWDGPIREQTWIPWAEEMSRAWRDFDPYTHLVTAGSVGLHWNVDGDEQPWYASPGDDLVQWHLYGKETYAPHALASAMSHKVKESWPFEKPVFCGEFAYGGEDPSTYDHTHVGIWSLAMSGAGALAHTAPPFTIDSDEPMTPERAAHFKVLSWFLHSLDRGLAYSPASDVRVIEPPLARAWSLATDDKSDRAAWILAPAQHYGERVVGAKLGISAPRGARYRVTWFDDTTGERLSQPHEHVATNDDVLVLPVPPFTRHAAARISHE